MTYNDHYNKFFWNSKSKSKELDFLKELDQIVEYYNKDENGHYILKVVKALKRGWY
jgi:hypothetical protein